MVRYLGNLKLTQIFTILLFLTGFGGRSQIFEKTIDADLPLSWGNSVSFAQLGPTTWVSTFKSGNHFDTHILEISQETDSLSCQTYPILSYNDKVSGALIISELSKNDTLTLCGIVDDTNNTSVLVKAIKSGNSWERDTFLVLAPDTAHSLIQYRASQNLISVLLYQVESDQYVYASFDEMQAASVFKFSAGVLPFVTDFIEIDSGRLLLSGQMPFLVTFSLNDMSVDTIWNDTSNCLDTMRCTSQFLQIVQRKNGQYIVGGTTRMDRDPTITEFDIDQDISILLFDSNHSLLDEKYFGKRDTIVQNQIYNYLDEEVGFRSLAQYPNGDLLVTGTSNIKLQSSASFTLDTSTSIFMVKLNAQLDTIWHSHYSQGNFRYFNYACQPLDDGGAIVYSYRYDYETYPNKGLDLHVFRIKENGELFSLGINDDLVIQSPFSLYPNPTSRAVNVKGPLSRVAKIQFSDMHGRVLKTIRNTNRMLDVSDIPLGLCNVSFWMIDGSIYSIPIVVM